MTNPIGTVGAEPDLGAPGAVLLGRYELRELVGRGRRGPTWRAHDLLLRRDVALRVLRTSLAADPGRAREQAHAVSRAAAQVHHTRLAALYDIAELDGDVVLVGEFLVGRPLDRVLATTGPLDAPGVARLGALLAGGLAAAHDRGVVHGDLTPVDVVLGVDDGGTPDGTAALAGVGTAPPERGAPVTPAGDVWALGAVLVAAAGAPPPRESALGSLLAAMLAPDPATRPDAHRARAALEALAAPVDEGPAGLPPGPGDEEDLAGVDGAPVPTVPPGPAGPTAVNPPTRTWTPSDVAPGPRAARGHRRPGRLVGAGVVGAGLLAVGAVGAVVASVSPSASTTAAALPAPEPASPAPTPAVEPPITPPADPAPPISAVPMDADPVLTAAGEDSRPGDRDEDRDRDEADDSHERRHRDSDDGDDEKHDHEHDKKDDQKDDDDHGGKRHGKHESHGDDSGSGDDSGDDSDDDSESDD